MCKRRVESPYTLLYIRQHRLSFTKEVENIYKIKGKHYLCTRRHICLIEKKTTHENSHGEYL